jgi:hypothetical protein
MLMPMTDYTTARIVLRSNWNVGMGGEVNDDDDDDDDDGSDDAAEADKNADDDDDDADDAESNDTEVKAAISF